MKLILANMRLFEMSEEVKQRIGRPGHQDLVAGIGQEFEEV
jgi:hypothetical protein